MGFLDNITTKQKLIGGGIAGVGGLYLLSKANSGGAGGGANGSLAVVDVRRPTDDINAPAGVGAGGERRNVFNPIINVNPKTVVPDANYVGERPKKPKTDGPIKSPGFPSRSKAKHLQNQINAIRNFGKRNRQLSNKRLTQSNKRYRSLSNRERAHWEMNTGQWDEQSKDRWSKEKREIRGMGN